MASALLKKYSLLILTSLLLTAVGTTPSRAVTGQFAVQQTRHIASQATARVTNPADRMRMTAEYLQQQFQNMGYQSGIRHYPAANSEPQAQPKLVASSTIAARRGVLPQEIILFAHIRTPAVQETNSVPTQFGKKQLPPVDGNTASLGVMLELAKQLAKKPISYSIRFVITNDTQDQQIGVENYLQQMSDQERKNTLLAISIDQLMVGKTLTFLTGTNTAKAVRTQTLNLASNLALHRQIPLLTGQLADAQRRVLTPYEQIGLPFLLVTTTNLHTLLEPLVYKQPPLLPGDRQKDNLTTLTQHFPHRLALRSRQTLQILVPLLEKLLTPSIDH